MKSIGPGVKEIREYDHNGIYRVVYLAKFPEAVYVIHCFQKKTEATSKPDIDLAKTRYKNLIKDRK